jgi:hypothetical protein
MGLAASQSRFLALTARKASCEFQSMQIAQQKLSVTRDLQGATEKYYRSMDATKLVWNMDGANSGGINSDLSYNLLMKASAMNDYTPVFVTDRTGKILLDSRYKSAAQTACIDPNGGESPNITGRDKFVLALADQGVIPKDIAMKIVYEQGTGMYVKGTTANGIPAISFDPKDGPATGVREKNENYNTQVGTGVAPLDKTYSNTMNINNLILYTEDVVTSSTSKTYKNTQTKQTEELSDEQQGNVDDLAKLLTFTFTNTSNLKINGQPTDTKKITLKELLTKDVTADVTAGFTPVDDSLLNLGTGLTAGENHFVTQLAALFNKMFVGDKTTTDTQAIGYALSMLGSTNNTNLSQVTKEFFTYYAQALAGFNDPAAGYGVNTTDKSKSNLVTGDYDYMYIIENVYNSDLYQDNESLMYADFYNIMYNNLCLTGYSTPEAGGHELNDKESLAHALKNGQIFLSSLNNDGYYYQGEYTRNGFVEEIKDLDAITRAETEYTLAKNKLNFKEEQLNLKLKNVDMEISAITTEYDAVKGMVSKNVEKAFQMFQ